MISRIKPIIYVFVLALGFSFLSPLVDKAEAKVIWGKIELKQGMIGKVTILKDTDLYRLTNNKLYVVRKAKKGQEFGVYSYKKDFGGLYGLGGGIYVKKSSSVKYETPSKQKLQQLVSDQQSQLLDGIRMGMNVSQVKAIAGKTGTLITEASDNGITVLEYKGWKFNFTADIVYYFQNNRLIAVWYDFVEPKKEYLTTGQMEALFYTLLDKIEPKIGQAGYIADYNYYDDGYYGYSTIWKKANMNIILYVNDENGYTTARLGFQPIE